jgi:hypothetical protein
MNDKQILEEQAEVFAYPRITNITDNAIPVLEEANIEDVVRFTAALIQEHGSFREARDFAERQYEDLQRQVSDAIRACIAIGGTKFTNEVLDELRPQRDFWWSVFAGLGGHH